jgi:putative heme iron utilization protein
MAIDHDIPNEGRAATSPPRPQVPEPPFAERVRTLLHTTRLATLSTQSAAHPGFPFGSLAPYGLLRDGSPTLLISRLAVHTKNIVENPRASLFVAAANDGQSALALSRVTLVGNVARVEEGELEAARTDYLARHEDARGWVDFGDFAFYRLTVEAAYFVAGFGAMGWVDPADIRAAAPDPLCDAAAGMIAHMNADHADAIVLYCRCFAGMEGVESAEMIDVDRLGFGVRAKTADGERRVRIAFTREAATPMDTRKVLVEMVKDARAKLGVEAPPTHQH